MNYFGLGDLYFNIIEIFAWVVAGLLPYLLTPNILQHTRAHTHTYVELSLSRFHSGVHK